MLRSAGLLDSSMPAALGPHERKSCPGVEDTPDGISRSFMPPIPVQRQSRLLVQRALASRSTPRNIGRGEGERALGWGSSLGMLTLLGRPVDLILEGTRLRPGSSSWCRKRERRERRQPAVFPSVAGKRVTTWLHGSSYPCRVGGRWCMEERMHQS